MEAPSTVYLSRVAQELSKDDAQQLPDAWLRWDILAQGLLSRFLAREAPTQGTTQAIVPESSWVVLRPFDPDEPRFYGVWNSKSRLREEDLKALRPLAQQCYVDREAFTENELKVIQSVWGAIHDWTP